MNSFENFTTANSEQLAKNKEAREKERKNEEMAKIVGKNEDFVKNSPEIEVIVGNAADNIVSIKRKSTEAVWKHRGEKRELEKDADTDPLTGLSNRRSFEKYIVKQQKAIEEENLVIENKEKAKSVEKREKLFNIFIIDLDRFKNINDTYGHDAGDRVLAEVSNVIQNNLRKGKDKIARWGGEEFIVAVQNDDSNSIKIAERLRKAIEDTVVEYKGEKISVTASVGVSSYSKSTDNMYDTADKALYVAKGEKKKIEKEELNIAGDIPTEQESRNQVWYYDTKSQKYAKYK